VTQQSPERRPRFGAAGTGNIVSSFAYGFVIGLVVSIVFEGFDIGPNLLQAAIFGVIFTVVHLAFKLLRSQR
jgi:hypothetical protein